MNIAQLLYDALVVGCFYALVSMGFVLVFRVSGVFNFAQPAFMLLGGLIYTSVNHSPTIGGVALGVAAAVAVCTVASAVFYRVVMASMVGRPHFAQMVLTFGLTIVMVDVEQMAFGSATRNVAIPLARDAVRLPFGIGTNMVDLASMLVSLLLSVAVIWLVSSSRLGSRIRAIAENPRLASYAGLRVQLILAATWAIAGAIAALAGIVYGARIAVDSGMVGIGLAAFPAAMLGGMESPVGAVAGGVLLGLLQGVAVSMFGGSIAESVGFAAMLVILLVRPYGLFGLRPVERV
jgi:branched-chain amino acid transport system permease protein